MTDLETARRIADGDADTVDAFVRTHYTPLLRFLRHLTRRAEDAEDLTQQAFLTLRTKAAQFRGESSLRTYLHRLAYREFLGWRRKRVLWRSPEREPRDHDWPRHDDAIVLMDALAKLPAKPRDAFLIHEVHGFDVQEAAAMLGIPVGTVLSRLHTARRHLRAQLGEPIPDQEASPHGELQYSQGR